MNLNVDKAIPRKLSIAVVTLVMLQQANAPPWCIMAVGIAAIVAQTYLDKEKNNEEDMHDPINPADL